MQENDSWRKAIPRKVNDTCVKTMHAEMMDRDRWIEGSKTLKLVYSNMFHNLIQLHNVMLLSIVLNYILRLNSSWLLAH
jgi:hypothetical protein